MQRLKVVSEENRTKNQKIQASCLKCKMTTNHLVLSSIDIHTMEIVDKHDVDTCNWEDNYQIIQCQGCDRVSFRHLHFFSEYQDEQQGTDGLEEFLYPHRTVFVRTTKDYYSVPPNIRRIYRETVDCLNRESLMLCAAGLRALVEGICAEQGVVNGNVPCTKPDGTSHEQKKNNLEGKIFGLAQKNVLTSKNAEILHQHRFLGNDAMHELSVTSKTELDLALDIVENVLDTLYEIPDKGDELSTTRDRRLANEAK